MTLSYLLELGLLALDIIESITDEGLRRDRSVLILHDDCFQQMVVLIQI